MMSFAIASFPFLCSLKTFFSNLHKEHYLPFFIFAYLFFSFLQLTPIEIKTSTKVTAILKVLTDEELLKPTWKMKGLLNNFRDLL